VTFGPQPVGGGPRHRRCCIAAVQALRAQVRGLRTGDPDRAARATFQALRRNGQVVVNTLVAQGVISAAGSPAAQDDLSRGLREADEDCNELNS
jgi:hypothetical protein